MTLTTQASNNSMSPTAPHVSRKSTFAVLFLGIAMGISFHAMFSFHTVGMGQTILLNGRSVSTGTSSSSSLSSAIAKTLTPTKIAPIYGDLMDTNDDGIDDRPLVMIATCTRSNSDWKTVLDSSFHLLLLPSLHRTVSIEELLHRFRIEIITVFDTGDTFWENAENRQALQNTTRIPINFVSISKDPARSKGRIPMNEMCLAAYEYQADYLIRINDDTEFIKFSNWITHGVETLQLKYQPSNVGVVGPQCLQGNTAILTHDMVHLPTHMSIFKGDYYPDEFDNWYLDDWITHVYGKDRTSRLSTGWEVFHHTGKHGTRYDPNTTYSAVLQPTIQRDSKSVEQYLEALEKGNTKDLDTKFVVKKQVLGTDRVGLADGPIAELHYKLLKERRKKERKGQAKDKNTTLS